MIQVQKPFPDGFAYKFTCGFRRLLACSLKVNPFRILDFDVFDDVQIIARH